MRYILFLLLAVFTPAHSLPYGFDAVRIMVALLGYFFVIRALLKREVKYFFKSHIITIYLLFAVSISWSIDKQLTFKYISSMLLFLSTYIVVASVTKNDDHFFAWRYYYIAISIVTSLYALYLFSNFGTLRQMQEMKSIVSDIVFDLLAALPVLVFLLVSADQFKRKILFHALIGVTLFVIFLSQSRAAILALLVGSVLTLYALFIDKNYHVKGKINTAIKVTIAIFSIALLFGLAWDYVLTTSFKKTFIERMQIISPSAEIRAEYLRQFNERQVALEDMTDQLKEHWWVGIGFGAFPSVSTNKVIVHNIVLDMWLSVGLLGVPVVFLFLGETLMRFYVRGKNLLLKGDRMRGYFSLTMAISFVMTIVHGMAQPVWFENHLYILAALSIYDAGSSKYNRLETDGSV